MITFNPVFTKHLLSAHQSFITVYTFGSKTSSRGIQIFVFSFLDLSWTTLLLNFFHKGLDVQQMLSSLLVCRLRWWSGLGGHYAPTVSGLMGHSSAVELQMRRKGGLASMAAFFICITWVSGGCSRTYRPLKFPEIPRPELSVIMGSHTKDKAHRAFTASLREY